MIRWPKWMKGKKSIGWWEEYACGCVSETTHYKKDLLGYCKQHGDSRRQIYPDYGQPIEKEDK